MERFARTKTLRRYLHPPLAERMFTMWAEGKIILGENPETPGYREYFSKIYCSGIWFAHGEAREQFDFKEVKNKCYDNGIPIHTIVHNLGTIEAEIEAFSSQGRTPTCYIKVSFRNNGTAATCESFGFFLRRGLEGELIFGAPDVYASYNPDINIWKDYKTQWDKNDNVFYDGDNFVTVKTDLPYSFDAQSGYVEFPLSLEANQSAEMYLALGQGEQEFDFDYNSLKESVVAYWEKELSRINNLPKGLSQDPERLKMVKHLVATILQNFCYYQNWEIPVLRQGGLQRRVWSYEASLAIQALSKLGDFGDYIEPIIEVYFKNQKEDGEIAPLGVYWASTTATSAISFLHYAEFAGRDYYLKYRDNAYKAFLWIKNTRVSGEQDEKIVNGLFPPLRGSDHSLEFQSWGATDSLNLEFLSKFCSVAKLYNDDKYSEILEEYNDYYSALRACYDKIKDAQEGSEELFVPCEPTGKNEEVLKSYLFDEGIYLILDLVADSEEDLERVYKYFENRGRANRDVGIHCIKMRNLEGHGTGIWYTTIWEYHLFNMYYRWGKLEQCDKVIDSIINYSMTDEYYMFERYCEKDVYFSPWCPNVSANGRLLNMLFERYNLDKG